MTHATFAAPASSTAARASRWWSGVALVLGMAFLTGCAGTLPQVQRETITTEAIAGSNTTALGRIVEASVPQGQHSGFRLMPLGAFSFDTRIQLARRAEASLDVQYYHLEGDETGRFLLRELRDAAGRGVRVRLLVDDLYMGGHDELFLGLAAHANVEIRLFNPFTRFRESGQATRFLLSFDWGRVNHRMHNKMFIADGVGAVIGGRNIANEYFLRSESGNFVDMDAFVVGKLVEPLAALFDRYWNSDPVYPLLSVTRSVLSPAELKANFDRSTGPALTPPPDPLPPNDILGYGPIREDLEDGRLGLIWGEAYAFADHPDKPFEGEAGGELLETSVTYNIIEPMMKAKNNLTISSPYFVPGPRGMALLKQLRDRGVKISVMTNSLGATDEQVVHIGYTRYREEMLAMGIELYELSSSRIKKNTRLFHFGSGLGRLHAKLLVVDGQLSFIGSMNFDPRSATINTELGAIIDSKPLARELLRVIDLDRLQSAYKVRLAASGVGCEWLTVDEDGKEQVLTEEPDSTFWTKLKLMLLRPLVPESLL